MGFAILRVTPIIVPTRLFDKREVRRVVVAVVAAVVAELLQLLKLLLPLLMHLRCKAVPFFFQPSSLRI